MGESGRYQHAWRGVGAGPRPFMSYAHERPRAPTHPRPSRPGAMAAKKRPAPWLPGPRQNGQGHSCSRLRRLARQPGNGRRRGRAPAAQITRHVDGSTYWNAGVVPPAKVSPPPGPPTSARKENLRFPTSPGFTGEPFSLRASLVPCLDPSHAMEKNGLK